VALGGDTGVPASLLELPDDLQSRPLTQELVSFELIALIACLKLTNKRLCKLMRNEMCANPKFRDDLRKLFLLVKGTQIPCGAEIVEPLPQPKDMDELFAIFRSALASRPALKLDAIEVGGAYKGGGSDLRLYNASMTHDSDGEPDIDYIDPMWHAEGGKQSLLLCVQIEFAPIDMFRAWTFL